MIGFVKTPKRRAEALAKRALKNSEGTFRKGKRPCPVCKFEPVLVTISKEHSNIWCVRCHLMIPNNVYHIKTGKRVKF